MARHRNHNAAAVLAADQLLAAQATKLLRATRTPQDAGYHGSYHVIRAVPPRPLTAAERMVQRTAALQALAYPARKRLIAVRSLHATVGSGADVEATGAAPGTTTPTTSP